MAIKDVNRTCRTINEGSCLKLILFIPPITDYLKFRLNCNILLQEFYQHYQILDLSSFPNFIPIFGISGKLDKMDSYQ